MAKYIDREALVEWLNRIPLKDLSDGLGLCRVIMEDDFKKAIKKMPKGIIADVEPVRHGRWVKIYESGEPAIEQHQVGVFCSRCMKMPKDRFTESDFCPNCGAKMDGVDDG